MFKMDVVRKTEEPGFVLLGADVEDIKNNLSNLDLKRALTDMDYMDFIKETLLMQDELWGRLRYVYQESKIFGFLDGHIWIKAKVLEKPDVLEAYRNLMNVEKDWKYNGILDQIGDSEE